MQDARFTTRNLFLLGLILFLTIQTSQILTAIVLLPLEPFYEVAAGSGGLRREFLSIVSQYYFLLLAISLLVIVVAILVENSQPTGLSTIEQSILFAIGLFVTFSAGFFELSLLLGESVGEARVRFVLNIFGLLFIFTPLLLIGFFIISIAFSFKDSQEITGLFIERNLKSWIPSELTSTEISLNAIVVLGAGLLAFNTILLLEPLPILSENHVQHLEPLHIISDESVFSELLLLSSEAIILGAVLLLLTVLLDLQILPGLNAGRCDLKKTIAAAAQNLRSANKGSIIGFTCLLVMLLQLERGLLLQRFWGERWVIDPLLDFIDILARIAGAVVNPLLALIGNDFQIKPPFKRGFWQTSESGFYRVIFRNLGEGAKMTLSTSLAGLFFGLILGTLIGLVRVTSHIPFPFVGRRISHWLTALLQKITSAFVEVFRGTPLMAQIFFIWVGLPSLIRTGITLPFVGWEGGSIVLEEVFIGDPEFILDILGAGILALSLNTAAYQSEIIRSGIQAIPSGQLEAARSLGMPYSQGMRHVVLPQAFRLIIPPLTNEFINLILNSSLLMIMSIFEMTLEARKLSTTTFRPFEIYGCLMIAYFAMTFVLSRIFRRVEDRFKIPGLGVS
ncbi:MAG: amino acid ABC transporter permease [Candidatus Hodarchaeota archaeon]